MLLLFFVNNQIQALNKVFPEFRVLKGLGAMHNEIVGTFAIGQLPDNQLLLTAKVEKRHFVHALKKEGTCEMKDMIRVCGNEYLIENFQVEVNGRKMNLNQESLNTEKDYIIITYTIDLSDSKIEEIKVKSDYMFKYNDHSILRVIFELGNSTRSFNIKNRKRTIIAKF